MLAAERFERSRRKKGSRNGPLGTIALEVLRELLRLVDYKSGRLEPALATLMQRCKRSKDAIVRALSNLRAAGFLDWLRRWSPTQDPNQPVKQATNAYRLTMPPAAALLLGARGQDVPVPDDAADRGADREDEFKRMVNSMEVEDRPAVIFGSGPLAQSVSRLARALKSGWKESLPDGQNPAPDSLKYDK